MTARHPINADDGGYVVRVPRDVQCPTDHTFLSSREPLPIVQYARDMTLARGRILYEVTDAHYISSRGVFSMDQGRHVVIGYVIPRPILFEAIERGRRSGSLSVAYAYMSKQERITFFGIYRKVMEKFPRIDETAVRMIAERLASHGTPITNSNIESAVVDHVSYMWTSYQFRIEQGQSKGSAKEAIKPRSRDVLTRWLSRGVSFEQFHDLWRRWDLVDAPRKIGGYVRSLDDEQPVRPSNEITYYAGKETVANLMFKSGTFL